MQRPTIIPGGVEGALLLLDRPVSVPANIALRDWDLDLEPSQPFAHLRRRQLGLAASTPYDLGERVQKSRASANRGLDVLAANGAGAYRLRSHWEPSAYWWTDENGIQVHTFGSFDIPFDFGMTVTNTEHPSDVVARTPKPEWSAAFRFFRMAQSATDPYSAFRDTFLAVEHLLSQATPRRAKEYERDWLERALNEFDVRRPKIGEQSWLDSISLGDFAEDIYKRTRHPLFHAKDGERFLTPLEPHDEADVSAALVPLTRMFLELASEVLHWPLNERPQIDEQMREAQEWKGSLDVVPFNEVDGARTFPRNAECYRMTDGSIAMSFGTPALSALDHIDGWVIAMDQTIVATETLPYRLNTSGIERFTIHLRPQVLFRGMIRTAFP